LRNAKGFAWELRWPSALEWLAMALVGASVPLSLRAHRSPSKAVMAAHE